MATNDKPLKIPHLLQSDVEHMIRLTDGFCQEHLDDEYAALCRKLIGKLARKRPSPLDRGDLRIWAAAVLYTIGRVNFLFNRAEQPHLTGDQLSSLTGVPKGTMTAKSKLIWDMLRIRQLEPTYSRQKIMENRLHYWMFRQR